MKTQNQKSTVLMLVATLIFSCSLAAWADCGYGWTAAVTKTGTCSYNLLGNCVGSGQDYVTQGGCDGSNNYLCTTSTVRVNYNNYYCSSGFCITQGTSGSFIQGTEQAPNHCGG